MSFVIENIRKPGSGDLHFHTAKGRSVTLRSGKSVTLGIDEVNVGLVRSLMGARKLYKVRADDEDAELMMMEASEMPRKPKGSPIVHGSTEPPDYNKGRDKPIEVRDDKGDPDQSPAETTKDLFIKEEQKPETPPQEPPKPEETPLQKLIKNAADLPFGEFRASARELLGDAFPSGNPGRGAILEALQKQPQE